MSPSSFRPCLRPLAIAVFAAGLAACQPAGPDAASAGTDTSRAAAELKADISTAMARPAGAGSADPVCRLLTDAEVRAVFPGAGAGTPEHSREQYGIGACVWSGDFGRFVLQTWKAKGRSAEDEARGLVIGFVDPLSRDSDANVRYEPVSGLDGQAWAVLETQDPSRGILSDIAMLSTVKNDQALVMLSDDLARRDRSDALSKLRSLAQSASSRL
jgi:hypothetical protein